MKKYAAISVIILSILLSSNIHASVNTGVKITDLHEFFGEVTPTANDTVTPAEKDTTEIKFKNKKIRIVGDKDGTSIEVNRKEDDFEDFEDDDDFEFGNREDFDIHWAGFEFGINNYLNNDFSMDLSEQNSYMELNTSKSWNINLNILEYELPIIKDNFGVGTGLGFEFNDYRFDNMQPVKKEGEQIVTDTAYNQFNVDKAKLTTTYITVPLLFEYQTQVNNDNTFFITAGIIGGIKIGSHTKVVYTDNGDKQKKKNRSDFHLSPLRYGYTVKMGYGFLKLFANYYDTTLFQNDKGPELHPFTVGFIVSF